MSEDTASSGGKSTPQTPGSSGEKSTAQTPGSSGEKSTAQTPGSSGGKSTAQTPGYVPILSRLRAPKGAVRNKHRLGRGIGSRHGKTCGRGMKGQKARQPGNIHKLNFEGGQMPLARRIPKRGFNNIFALRVAEVNIRDLARFGAGATVDVDALVEVGLVKGRFDVVKMLGNGELDRKLTVKLHRFSKGAKAKIEGAGGTAEIVPLRDEPRRVEGETASE